MDSSPTLQEWRELYHVAMEFKRLGCWNWMSDSDVFGVQNPETGEIGYCCIMGMAGKHFALAVYLGTDGLDGYLKIQSGNIPTYPPDSLMLQRCLMASFEDRKSLQEPDLKVIKNLGLKFRGRNSWPLFRSYRPWYHPWYLTCEEARFLTLALRQVMEFALRFKKDTDILKPPKKNHYLVRIPKKKGKGIR